jgi:hypothetical protein
MKFNLVGLKKYKKLLSGVGEKGHAVYESLLLDTANSRILFFASSYTGQIKISLEKDQGEKDDFFFISKATFITLLQEYTELKLENRKFISADGEYELANFEDSLSLVDFSTTLTQTFDVPESLSAQIKSASEFADQISGPLNGIFFYQGHIVGTDRSQFFDFIFDPAEPQDQDLAIPLSLIRIYDQLPSYDGVSFSFDDKTLRILYKDELIVHAGRNADLSCPPVTDDAFKAMFKHPNSVKLNTKVFIDLVAFMKSFVQDSPSHRIHVVFKEDGHITFEALDFSKAKRSIPCVYSDFTYFEGKDFWLSADALERTLRKVATTEISLLVDNDQPAIDFSIETNFHIVCTKLWGDDEA